MDEPKKNPLLGIMVGDAKPDGGNDKHDCAQDILDAIKADNPAKLSAALDDYQTLYGSGEGSEDDGAEDKGDDYEE